MTKPICKAKHCYEESLSHLEGQNRALRMANASLRTTKAQLEEKLAFAHAEIQELRDGQQRRANGRGW